MPQFSMIPEREKILARIPDYTVQILPEPREVVVNCGGQPLAVSRRALLVKETKHADVYYLPQEDVNMSALLATDHSTYCPFKGHASYWSASIHGESVSNLAWSYESPYPEVAKLKDYMSFYTDQTDITVSSQI